MTSAKVVETSVMSPTMSISVCQSPTTVLRTTLAQTILLISSSLDMTPGFKSLANYIKKRLSILAKV